MLVHCCKSNVIFELSFEQSWVSYVCCAPFFPLGYTFWCSVNTPELLVVALHQALFITSGFAFHFNHSFLTSYLSLS